MKRNFILVALGSSGDVNPMIGIALELERRGHSVTFISNPVFETFTKESSIQFVPLGTAKDYDFVWDPDTWRWWRIAKTFKKGWLPFVRPTYESIASQQRPDGTVLVANSIAPGALIASEKLSLPLVMVTPNRMIFECLDDFPNHGPFQNAPRMFGRISRRIHRRMLDLCLDRWVGKGVNAFREELGLARGRRFFSTWANSAVIGLWPEWFAGHQSSWPKDLRLHGFLNYDRGDSSSANDSPPAMERTNDAPIVFTCGSAMTHGQDFVDLAIGVHQILNRPVVIVTDQVLQPRSALPPGVSYSSYVPYRELLPTACAIVHHGGIGTCSAALAAGLPQLIVPLAFDQFDNAEVCEKHGVARRIARSFLKPRRVAERLSALIHSPSVQARCRELALRVDSESAMARVCDEIEAR